MRSLLDGTARDVGAAGRDGAFGYGIVDYAALVNAATSGAAPAQHVAPNAAFTWSASGLSASVRATTSSSIVSYAWTWGDGATGSGATASHAYAAGGSYAVTLTVTDNVGTSSSTTQTVTVTAPAVKDHVGDILAASQVARNSAKITWTAPILSASSAGVPGATVAATLTGPGISTSLSATSASDGSATFAWSAKKLASGTYTLCVTNVALAGWTYDPSANVETCQASMV
jgi:PKD repeat protein